MTEDLIIFNGILVVIIVFSATFNAITPQFTLEAFPFSGFWCFLPSIILLILGHSFSVALDPSVFVSP